MKQSNFASHLIMLGFIMSLFAIPNAVSSSLVQAQRADMNSIKIKDAELYNRVNISGWAGTQTFLDNRSEYNEGVCNVKDGQLPNNQLFAFSQISIGYDTGEVDNEAGLTYDKKAPAALRNSEFFIEQRGRKVVMLPASSLVNLFTAEKTEDQFYTLRSLAYLTDGESFEWGFKLPKGTSIPAAAAGANGNHYAEVILRGSSTYIQKG